MEARKTDRPSGIKYSSSLLITLFQTWVLSKESGSVNLLSWSPMDMMLVDELLQGRKGSHTYRAHAEKQQGNIRLNSLSHKISRKSQSSTCAHSHRKHINLPNELSTSTGLARPQPCYPEINPNVSLGDDS